MKRLVSVLALATAFSTQALANFEFDEAGVTQSCTEFATKRGVINDRDFRSCMKANKRAADQIPDLYKKYTQITPVKDIDVIVQNAYKKGTGRNGTNYHKIVFQIEYEAEAYLDLQYDLKEGNIKQSRFNLCAEMYYKQSNPRWKAIHRCSSK